MILFNCMIPYSICMVMLFSLMAGSLLANTVVADDTIFYVSNQGNNDHSGAFPTPNAENSDGPFATLVRARDAIRERKKLGQQGPFTVLLRGGNYFLEKTFKLAADDSGSKSGKITYAAYEQETPILIGGISITGFQKFRGRILVADVDLSSLPNQDFFKQVFHQGKRQILARHPNFDPKEPYSGGWAYVDGEPISMHKNIPDEPKNRFVVKQQDVRSWTSGSEGRVFVFPRYNWWNHSSRIESFDQQTRQLVLDKNATYAIRPNDRYYTYNFLEELDAPGEWYFDRKEGKLYFYPPEGSSFEGQVIVPTLSILIHCRDTQHVEFRGLTVRCSRGLAFHFLNCTETHIVGCSISLTGTSGVDIRSGLRCSVRGCNIESVGTTAITLVGGDRETLTAGENVAENNYIHHTGVYFKQGVGISLSGVGNRASRNLIHDCPRFGLMIRGNDQVIEGNHLRHLNLETSDTGATYSGGRDWLSPRGTVLRYNYIHDTFGFGKELHSTGKWVTPHHCWGIYLDDNSAEVTIYGNIVVRAKRGLLHFHNARDITVENNIFIDGHLQQIEMNGWKDHDQFLDRMTPAYEKYSQLLPWQKYVGLKKGGHPRDAIPMGGNRIRRNILSYSAPDALLYKYRYFATRFLEDFECDENLIWHQGQPIRIGGMDKSVAPEQQWARWQEMGFDQKSRVADPLFVDLANDDYRLQKNSPAWKIGFEPIPVDKIGPYASPDRVNWPIVEAAGARELGMFKAEP